MRSIIIILTAEGRVTRLYMSCIHNNTIMYIIVCILFRIMYEFDFIYTDKVPSMEMLILIKFVNKESNEEEFRTTQKVGHKWRNIATLLRIETVNNIADNPMNTDPEAAASSMLQHWLEVDTSASWKKLCKAMRDANLKADAKTLEYALAHMITNE